MAIHEITLRENTSATGAEAPFLGRYVVKGNVDDAAVIAKVAAEAKLTDTVARAIIEGTFDAIAEEEREGLTKFNLGPFIVYAAVTGSFPSSDAAFDAERNRLQLVIRFDDDTRLYLANITPTILTDATSTKVRIDTVTDVATPRPYSVIHGQNPFKCQGYNLVMTDEGADIRLLNRNKQTFACVVDEMGDRGFLVAHTAELLEPGDYKVVVRSRGGDGEGKLQTAKRNVKYLRVENPNAPVVTSAYPIDHQDDTENLREGEAFMIEGRNFGGTSVKYQYKHGEDGWSGLSEPLDGDEEYLRNEENTEIEVFRQTVNGILTDNELDTGDLVKFVITNSDGSASVQRTVQLA